MALQGYNERRRGFGMAMTFEFGPETSQRIENLVAKYGRTKAYYIRDAIARSLLDVEHEYGLKEGLDQERAGEVELYPPDWLWKNQPPDDLDFDFKLD